MAWSIDGTSWDIPCTVERTSEMTSSEISGLLLDKSYFNDVIGTYLKYSLRLAVPFGYEEEYAAIYDLITEPVDGHQFVLPYSGGTLQVTGRVQNIQDIWVRMPGGKSHWRGITFEIISNAPAKTMTLGQVLTRGVAPLPDESEVHVGSAYIYASNGWEELGSSEDTYY